MTKLINALIKDTYMNMNLLLTGPWTCMLYQGYNKKILMQNN